MPWPFARVFRREKSALRNRATAEITDGDTVTDTVFDANNSALFADAAFAKQVTMAQVVEYPDVDVAGLFVLGVVFGFLEGRPTLPTPAYERALIFLLAVC